jgi:hypothetical protein
MLEYTFLVPVVSDSTRESHSDKLWEALEESLSYQFGGFTRHADVVGGWQDRNGDIIRDVSRKYSVMVAADKDHILFALLADYRKEFGQQCLYVARTSDDARLLF